MTASSRVPRLAKAAARYEVASAWAPVLQGTSCSWAGLGWICAASGHRPKPVAGSVTPVPALAGGGTPSSPLTPGPATNRHRSHPDHHTELPEKPKGRGPGPRRPHRQRQATRASRRESRLGRPPRARTSKHQVSVRSRPAPWPTRQVPRGSRSSTRGPPPIPRRRTSRGPSRCLPPRRPRRHRRRPPTADTSTPAPKPTLALRRSPCRRPQSPHPRSLRFLTSRTETPAPREPSATRRLADGPPNHDKARPLDDKHDRQKLFTRSARQTRGSSARLTRPDSSLPDCRPGRDSLRAASDLTNLRARALRRMRPAVTQRSLPRDGVLLHTCATGLERAHRRAQRTTSARSIAHILASIVATMKSWKSGSQMTRTIDLRHWRRGDIDPDVETALSPRLRGACP